MRAISGAEGIVGWIAQTPSAENSPFPQYTEFDANLAEVSTFNAVSASTLETLPQEGMTYCFYPAGSDPLTSQPLWEYTHSSENSGWPTAVIAYNMMLAAPEQYSLCMVGDNLLLTDKQNSDDYHNWNYTYYDPQTGMPVKQA